MYLSKARERETLVIEKVGIGCTQRLRLMELGLIPGAAITVRQGPGRGVTRVRVLGTWLSLGREQADAITLSEVKRR